MVKTTKSKKDVTKSQQIDFLYFFFDVCYKRSGSITSAAAENSPGSFLDDTLFFSTSCRATAEERSGVVGCLKGFHMASSVRPLQLDMEVEHCNVDPDVKELHLEIITTLGAYGCVR